MERMSPQADDDSVSCTAGMLGENDIYIKSCTMSANLACPDQSH